MSKQTQLSWAASSSSSRGPQLNGGSKDDRDLDMKEQPAHLKARTIYKANRSNSVTPNLPSSTTSLTHSATHQPATTAAQSSFSSVLGKRGSGRPSPFVFVDGGEPLDYTDFTQTKLPSHTLLYLCADRNYNNKHITQPADDSQLNHNNRRDTASSSSGSSSSSRMEGMGNGKEEKADQPTTPPQPHSIDPSVRYDAISTADDEHNASVLFSHHPFHRLYRSHKAALAAWKRREGEEKDSSGTVSGRVMEFACREPLRILHVNELQRTALFHSASASSSSSSSSVPQSYLPSPPALLSHLLSTHNDCVGYEVEGGEADGIVLTSDACECQLSLLDDDKRAHVSQALLTDMFARLHC